MHLEQLRRDGCHVWFARLDETPELDACRSWLSSDELLRLERFVVEPPRRLFLLAHCLARGVLSRYADVHPRDWAFAGNADGKPEIVAPAGRPPLRFNLSHSGGVAVCGVTLGNEIGVDVEDTRRAVDALGLSRRYFAPGEAADVAGWENPQRLTRFFAYWTVKEAVLKACGTGIAGGLAGFEVRFADDGSVGIRVREGVAEKLRSRIAPDEWTIHQQSLTEHHLLAVAVRCAAATHGRLQVHTWRPPVPGHHSLST